MTLGARRVAVSRPRVRTTDDIAEVGLESYGLFSSRDLLEQVVLERMLAGVSARQSRRVAEPAGDEIEQHARSTSKSAVSRTFVSGTRAALAVLLAVLVDAGDGGSAFGG
jgi:hypothetical protein